MFWWDNAWWMADATLLGLGFIGRGPFFLDPLQWHLALLRWPVRAAAVLILVTAYLLALRDSQRGPILVATLLHLGGTVVVLRGLFAGWRAPRKFAAKI